jgi:hypothetical protein
MYLYATHYVFQSEYRAITGLEHPADLLVTTSEYCSQLRKAGERFTRWNIEVE